MDYKKNESGHYAYMQQNPSENNIENLLAKVLWRHLWRLGLFHGRNTGGKVHVAHLPELGTLVDLPAKEEGEEDGDVDVCTKMSERGSTSVHIEKTHSK